jgi:6-phosphogluconate dehydrogenase
VSTARGMQLGMVGLGRMGANLVRRLLGDGHECVVYDVDAAKVTALVEEGATGAGDLAGLSAQLDAPRAIWLMVPAGLTDEVTRDIAAHLDDGDVIINGGNSHYRDDIAWAGRLADRGLTHLDVGTSGGVWGLERGFCLMIGGDADAVERLDPIFASIAPGVAAAPRTPGADGAPSRAERGYLHCGPAGAGHFVKMVHNGIEYGAMAALAEGLNVLRHADAGMRGREDDAETAPLRQPELFRYDVDVPAVAEVWRRGSVIQSWLLDLTAAALLRDPDLDAYAGRVSDSGEGRWTVQCAIDEGVPTPVLSAALFTRFGSQDRDEFANKVTSAMRAEFGGHDEKSV